MANTSTNLPSKYCRGRKKDECDMEELILDARVDENGNLNHEDIKEL